MKAYMTTLVEKLCDHAQWARHERAHFRKFEFTNPAGRDERQAGCLYALTDMEVRFNQAANDINLLSQSVTSTLDDALRILVGMRDDFEVEHQQIKYATTDYVRGRADTYQEGVMSTDFIIGDLKEAMVEKEVPSTRKT